jgi:hypothetical protein
MQSKHHDAHRERCALDDLNFMTLPSNGIKQSIWSRRNFSKPCRAIDSRAMWQVTPGILAPSIKRSALPLRGSFITPLGPRFREGRLGIALGTSQNL